MLPFPVPPATGGEISDEIIENACIPAADSLASDTLTTEQAALIQLTAAALFREVLQWRRRADLARNMLLPDNVIMMRAG